MSQRWRDGGKEIFLRNEYLASSNTFLHSNPLAYFSILMIDWLTDSLTHSLTLLVFIFFSLSLFVFSLVITIIVLFFVICWGWVGLGSFDGASCRWNGIFDQAACNWLTVLTARCPRPSFTVSAPAWKNTLLAYSCISSFATAGMEDFSLLLQRSWAFWVGSCRYPGGIGVPWWRGAWALWVEESLVEF